MLKKYWHYGILLFIFTFGVAPAFAQVEPTYGTCDQASNAALTTDYEFPRFAGAATRSAAFQPSGRIDGNYELDAGAIATKALPAEGHSRTIINVTNMLTDFGGAPFHELEAEFLERVLEGDERLIRQLFGKARLVSGREREWYDLEGDPFRASEQIFRNEFDPLDVESLRRDLRGDFIQSTNQLAFLYFSAGELENAMDWFNVLRLYHIFTGDELGRDAIATENNLSLVEIASGNYSLAEKRLKRSVTWVQEKHASDDALLHLSYNNLGILYKQQGRFKEAEDLFLIVYKDRESALGSAHPLTRSSANNLAVLFSLMGRNSEAEAILLSCGQPVRDIANSDSLIFVGNLASSYFRRGQFEKSSEALLWVISGWEQKQRDGPKSLTLAQMYSNLALLRADGYDDKSGAIFYQKSAINVLQRVRSKLGVGDAGAQKLFVDRYRDMYTDLQQWLIEAGRFAEAEQVGRMLKEEEYFDFIRRSEAGDDPRQTRSELTAREAEWGAQLAAWAERPNRVAVELASLKDRQRGGAELTALEAQQLADLESEYDIAYAAYKTEVDGWLARVRALSDDVIQEEAQALEAKFHDDLQGEIADIGADVAALQIVAFDDSLHFFLITPDAFKHVETEVSRAELYEAIFATRDALGDFTPASRAGGPAEAGSLASDALTPALQKLYTLLLEPVRGELEDAGTQTLMLNLQGPIRYAPFAALHDGEQYLTERFGLALFTPAARTRYQSAGSITDATGFGVSKEHEGFSPLPAVTRELEQLFPGEDGAGVLSGKVYPDEAFTRAAFETELEDSSPILHIASHFSMQPGDNTNSFLLLGDGNRLTLEDIHLSSDIRFRGVELLTLSACSTAISGEASGAEIEGLGSLAQRKGAEAVVATLWNVADDATATFMGRFYGGLSSGDIDKARALQAAQVSMIEDPKTAHPYYWAPYILMGNWK